MLENFEAYQLAKQFHQGCKPLKVPLYLRDQLLRASSSVVLNLAEGSGKRTPSDQKRFYTIALGSMRECRAILEMEDLGDPELRALADRTTAILYALSRKPRKPQTEAAPVHQTDRDTVTVTLPGAVD